MQSRWREKARQVITQTIAEVDGEHEGKAPEPVLRAAISAAYPFGERAMHPYKVWLSEVRYQLDRHFYRPPVARAGVDCPYCGDGGCLICGTAIDGGLLPSARDAGPGEGR